MIRNCLGLALAAIALFGCTAAAQDASDDNYTPRIEPASGEGELALARIRVPEGFRKSLWAAEPLLANPVAFCFDGRGRVYVAETFRLHAGVTDNRKHMYWVTDDLACRTVADRVEMYRKHLGEEFVAYGLEHDRVRRVEDHDGDGKADAATVLAQGFRDQAAGIGAGLLTRGSSVYFTCIPSVWLLTDDDDDGVAEKRAELSTGYGVHVGFLGHDLHGLIQGPDGKIYFSIGDRGLNVETPEGRPLFYPDTGCVLRMNPDGSELEVFATGLRNPQELAFDDHGNLFTGDNNSDAGDKARWVYLVEGGDSGWRIGYQFLSRPVTRGPWNAEKIWHTECDDQPAYHLPPLAHLGDGPSGLCFYPGTGLTERYQNHFFMADFRGTAALSGVRSFAVKPKGASFELDDAHQFAWAILATDCDFGPDGALYVSDWVEGWEKPGKGRIYKFDVLESADPPMQREVAFLLGADLSEKEARVLGDLLSHPDRRVRQQAQFALAAGGDEQIAVLVQAAKGSSPRLARLHAIWGLGQAARRRQVLFEAVPPLLDDVDEEVRSQAARILGEGQYVPACDHLIELMRDESPRVRFFAAMALGKLRQARAVPALIELLRENDDQDRYLRHAAVMGLAGCAPNDELVAAARDSSAAVRMGLLLTMRRLGDANVAMFLDDSDPRLVAEAARAINDLPIEAALPQLAKLVERKPTDEMLARRALNANFRLGGAENAQALVNFLEKPAATVALKNEVLAMLAEWGAPGGLDRVVGLWRPLPTRDPQPAADALRPVIAALLTDQPPEVAAVAAQTAAVLRLTEAAGTLTLLVTDGRKPANVRTAALRALETLADPGLETAVLAAVESDNGELRNEGRRLLGKVNPEEALRILGPVLESGETNERQGALTVLGTIPGEAADALLVAWLDKLLAGEVPPPLRLELLEACAKRTAAPVAEKLAQYEAARDSADPLAAYRECLEGGDAGRGRTIFMERAEVSCRRCHKIRTDGGEVGPELTKIAADKDRAYLLEAMVAPNAKIAKGFDTVVLATGDGLVVTGIVRRETDDEIELVTAEGQNVVVKKADIEERSTGISAMPDSTPRRLTRGELRDLVEFLSTLK